MGPLLGRQQRACAPQGPWLSLSIAALVLACGGDVFTLGSGDAEPSFGDEGRRVRYLNEVGNEEYDPTLTDDLLEIFFISDRVGGVGGKDVWYAERRSRTEPFDAPQLLVEASSLSEEASPAVSGDGLTLWVASRREPTVGGMDIWRVTRPERGGTWGMIEPVDALNSPFDDLPRPPGQRGTILPVASDRVGAVYQTFFARRAGESSAFSGPEPVEHLWDTVASMEDAHLSDDGLHLFFRRALRGQPGDLFVSWRTSTEEPFREPVALDAINSTEDDRDPFLSADRARFFFSSNRRDGLGLDIYATSLDLPSFE